MRLKSRKEDIRAGRRGWSITLVESASEAIWSASKLATALDVVGKGHGDGVSGAGRMSGDMAWPIQGRMNAQQKCK